MFQFPLLLLTVAFVFVASTPSEAARPRQPQVLDQDSLSLIEYEEIHWLTLRRAANGQAQLVDQTDATQPRVTPLGIALPQGPASADYHEMVELDSNGNVLAAIAAGDAIHAFELGGFTATAAVLDVQPLGSIATGPGLDLASVSAETARVWGDPHVDGFLTPLPLIGYTAGGQPSAIALVENAWVPVAPLGVYSPDLGESDIWCPIDACPVVVEDVDSLDVGEVFTLATLRSDDGELLLFDESAGAAPRLTPFGFTPPSGATQGAFLETPNGSVWAAYGSSDGIRVLDLGDLAVPGPLAPEVLDFVDASGGWDPTTVRTGIIAILIGVAVEPRPALFIGGTEGQIVRGWNGAAFAPVQFLEDEGLYTFF